MNRQSSERQKTVLHGPPKAYNHKRNPIDAWTLFNLGDRMRGPESPWSAAGAWWTVWCTVADLGCWAILLVLTRREHLRVRDLVGPPSRQMEKLVDGARHWMLVSGSWNCCASIVIHFQPVNGVASGRRRADARRSWAVIRTSQIHFSNPQDSHIRKG